MDLTIFADTGRGRYRRMEESFAERAYSLDQVREVVELSLSTEPTADYSQWSHYGKAVEPILEQAEAIEASADAKE